MLSYRKLETMNNKIETTGLLTGQDIFNPNHFINYGTEKGIVKISDCFLANMKKKEIVTNFRYIEDHTTRKNILRRIKNQFPTYRPGTLKEMIDFINRSRKLPERPVYVLGSIGKKRKQEKHYTSPCFYPKGTSSGPKKRAVCDYHVKLDNWSSMIYYSESFIFLVKK